MDIILENVCLRFGTVPILNSFSFSMRLPENGKLCLFGPSGCGKTTLLRCLSGLQKIESGRILGIPDKISCVFQEDRLLPWFSAEENVAAVLPPGQRGDAAQWLAKVGLGEARGKRPGELSGGMRQRVSLARALAYGGDLFLMDEPFHALDEKAKKEMLQLLSREASGAAIILVTHDREEIQDFGGSVCILEGPPVKVRAVLPVSEFMCGMAEK